jgi:hypothetical protein
MEVRSDKEKRCKKQAAENARPLIQYLKPQNSGEVAEWLKAAVC